MPPRPANVWLQAAIGGAASAAFLALGLWVLLYDLRMVALTLDSSAWPTAAGQVFVSALDADGQHPDVRYDYVVDGHTYEGRRIGFDLFDHPGGAGSATDRMARYPVDERVVVYYQPGAPEVAVLEPGDPSPFLVPSFFGLMFSAFGALLVVKTARYVAGEGTPQPIPAARSAPLMAGAMAVVVYVLLVLVALESTSRAVWSQVFDGLFEPWPTVVAITVLTAVYVPFPWVFSHLLRLHLGGVPLRGVWALLTVPGQLRAAKHPLARSGTVVQLGLAYFTAVVGAWIAFAAWRGL